MAAEASMAEVCAETMVEPSETNPGVDDGNTDLPPDKSSKTEWTSSRTAELIALWETFPCLYEVKSKAYHNRDAKKKATEEISILMNVNGKFHYIQQ